MGCAYASGSCLPHFVREYFTDPPASCCQRTGKLPFPMAAIPSKRKRGPEAGSLPRVKDGFLEPPAKGDYRATKSLHESPADLPGPQLPSNRIDGDASSNSLLGKRVITEEELLRLASEDAGAGGTDDGRQGEAQGPSAGEADENDEVDLELLEAVEREAAAAGGLNGGAAAAMDVKGLRRALLAVEKKLKENTELRLKYPQAPDRWVESEVELDGEVKRLQAVAGAPELYPDLVRLNGVGTLLSLLQHDNTDIAMSAVALLAELTDSDVVGDNEEEAAALCEAFVAGGGLEVLVQNLARLDEKDPDEAAAVFSSLQVVESVVEALPGTAAEAVGERTRLLRWLLARVRVREFDSNKWYASEVLAILLQGTQATHSNAKRVGAANGVDALLQAAAYYKSRDPRSAEEEECLENVFDALCSVVLADENKERFVRAEGVELCIITCKQKKHAYAAALKALDFACTRCPAACERFVDVLGLKTLFSAFMGKAPVQRRTKADTAAVQAEVDERVVSLIASLFAGLPSGGSRRDRLLSKFVEAEYEKIDRLLELLLRYRDRVQREERRQQAEEEQRKARAAAGEEEDEDDEQEWSPEARYLRRLEAGLFTLQLIAVILGHLWMSGHVGMQERILLLLRQQRLSLADIHSILQEYHNNIGDLDGEEEQRRRQRYVSELMEALAAGEGESQGEEKRGGGGE